jgi:hypothetical protein
MMRATSWKYAKNSHRSASLSLLLSVLWLGSAIPALAGDGMWTSNGPEAGNVYAMAIDLQPPQARFRAERSAASAVCHSLCRESVSLRRKQ